METWLLLLILFVALSSISILTWLLVREKRVTEALLVSQAATHRTVELRQLDVIEKAFAQLRASDPWQYQAIQAVAQPALYDGVYDPSEEAEAQRIAERSNTKDELKETLDAEDAAILDDLFPGFGG